MKTYDNMDVSGSVTRSLDRSKCREKEGYLERTMNVFGEYTRRSCFDNESLHASEIKSKAFIC